MEHEAQIVNEAVVVVVVVVVVVFVIVVVVETFLSRSEASIHRREQEVGNRLTSGYDMTMSPLTPQKQQKQKQQQQQ